MRKKNDITSKGRFAEAYHPPPLSIYECTGWEMDGIGTIEPQSPIRKTRNLA
jgi:hypothetical protein